MAGGPGLAGAPGLADDLGLANDPGLASEPAARLLADAGRLIIAWSRERSLSASAATGICLALALCAAGWFTAGTTAGNVKAVAALWASYLAALLARNLAAGLPDERRSVHGGAPAFSARARACWLVGLGWSLAEAIGYAGLAAGAATHHWPGAWTMAVSVLSLIAVHDLMATCSGPAGMTLSQGGVVWRSIDLLLGMPVGGRVLLVGFVVLASGGRAALFGLLDWSVIAVGYLLFAHGAPSGDEQSTPDQDEKRPAPPVPWSGTMVLLLSPAGEELRPPQAQADAPALPATGQRIPDGQTSEHQAGPGSSEAALQAALVRRLRDDGDLARWLGRPVRGNLLPLPPAVLGLVATATLAFLGLRGLPTYLFLAPALIMVLLAAPGSSNPHMGRLDWLVPPVLLGWQLLYLAAVGKSVGVPGPVTFAAITALLLWYADLAFPGRPVLLARAPSTAKPAGQLRSAGERGRSLGWEGRTLALGLFAAAGIGTYVYLAMTVYLAAPIVLKVLATRSAWVAPQTSRSTTREARR